jgi:hypothetical protein
MLQRALAALTSLVLTFALTASQAHAVPQEALDGYQQAVATKMDELVRQTLDHYFKEVGQQPPEHIDVSSLANFDLSKPEPTITKVNLAVTLTSDLPPEVVRQARQELVRALKSIGYRTDPLEAGEMPLVNFTIDSQPIDHSKEHNSLREYVVFAALVGGALLFSVLAINMLIWGLFPRRGGKKRRPRSSRRPGDNAGNAAHHTKSTANTSPVNYWEQSPQVDLPPFPGDTPAWSSPTNGLPPLRPDQGRGDS